MSTLQLLCVQCVVQALGASQVIAQPPVSGAPQTGNRKETRAALMCMSTGQMNALDYMWFDGEQLTFTPITSQNGDLVCIDHLR